MAKVKFPKLIHVTIERPDSNDEPYFQVWEQGVADMDEEKPVAIYQLVKIGHISITKQFKDR